MAFDRVLEEKLSECCKSGVLVPRTENNRYLAVSYKGAGTLVSAKWNVKIYTSGAIVCNDMQTLNDIKNDSLSSPNTSLKFIQIDDAGIGFPLCGVMIGVCIDYQTVKTDTIDVKLFQGPSYNNKEYLEEYTRKGLRILDSVSAAPRTHRVEICTGFINSALREKLRALGYDVRVADIGGLLQTQLESLFKAHVKEKTGQDLAYDPKHFKVSELGKPYYRALNWGLKHRPDLLKSGWNSIKDRMA